MQHFPEFMKRRANTVSPLQENTQDVEGYYYEGKDGAQMAFWECYSDSISQRHIHDFDEYMILVSGEFIAHLNGKEIRLSPGDELLIPKGTEQWGECKAGTRTIHAFGGKRIQ